MAENTKAIGEIHVAKIQMETIGAARNYGLPKIHAECRTVHSVASQSVFIPTQNPVLIGPPFFSLTAGYRSRSLSCPGEDF